MKDSLTGLFVRYRFDERAEEEFARARSGGVGLALLILDIDHFKQVNDRWGHPTGDQVLKSVAQVVMNQSRETDFCARYGGEEIAVLMPLTDVDKALPIAERIRRKVEDTLMGSQKIRVTVSGGVAAVQPSTKRMGEVVQAADQALYRAKKEGRNRIVAARP